MAGRTDDFRPTPGFQGSETSGVEVTIYNQGGDPIIFTGRATEFKPLRRGPKSNPETASPNLASVSTYKSIGSPSGSFNLTAKSARPNPNFIDLFDQVVDDDWVDISFTRHGRKWHTMRGLVDEIRRSTQITGTGATSTLFTITGRDFGKIWETTPVWFSPQAAENVHGHVAAKVFTTKAELEDSGVAGDSLVLENPAAAVRGYLFGFLEELAGFGRANWNPPDSVPNIVDGDFVKSLFLNTAGFTNLPDRKGIDPNFIMAGGNLWDLAREWSDPMFTELFCDLFVNGSQALQTIEAPIDETTMTVVYRDKPFPIVAEEWTGDKGKDSAWFSLPEFIIPREAVDTLDIGRSGLERFNAFFISSPLHQEALGANAIDIMAPLWDKDDILRHGLRRFDVNSKYGAAGAELLNLVEQQRAIIRDWYAINPYLFNGTLNLGVGMPDIRIGSRARIPGATTADHDESYYVESVANNWQFGKGTRTSLGVTRGWRGKDEALLEAMETLAGRYVIEPTAVPEEGVWA